jgi:xanthine phosphoribosyltransferase
MKKQIINQSEFNGLVAKIIRDIVQSDWKPDYIVGISRGGLIPAVMLSQWFNLPMKPLQISLRDHIDTVSDCGLAEDAFSGKNILIVDDINDQGSTLNWLMNDWPELCHPNDTKWNSIWNNNIRFAVIVDNLSSKCEVKMDYIGFEINKAEQNVWIEFPYEDWWTK